MTADKEARWTTFASYDHLSEPFKGAFREIEQFVAELDGKDIGTATDENTFIDDGTIDAESVVAAVNQMVGALTALERPATRELKRAEIISALEKAGCLTEDGWVWSHQRRVADAILSIDPNFPPVIADQPTALQDDPSLLHAIEQALDDMGADGLCVCQATKDMLSSAAFAIIADQRNET